MENSKMLLVENGPECRVTIKSVQDTMDILSGKWKLSIMCALSFSSLRFMDLVREVDGIRSKMLSSNLYELEINGLVKRTVLDTKPLTVSYELTEYGKTIKPIIHEMSIWGRHHRDKILGT